MKLMVTIGNAAGDTEELVFELPEPITWLGVEIEKPDAIREQEQTQGLSTSTRTTIVRIPFANHETGLHTMCQLNGDIMEVPFQ